MNLSLRSLLWPNLIVKFLAVGIVVLAILFPDMPQFQGKAMGSRLILYAAATFAVPLIWRFRFRKSPYPHLVDIIFLIPFVVDNLGNVFNLYASIAIFDDVAHWHNWVLLTLAAGSAFSLLSLNKKIIASLTIGFGAVTQMLWEIAEYVVMLYGSSKLYLTYEDTMFDFIMSGVGTLVGSFLAVTLFWRAKLMPRKKKKKT